MNLDIALTHEIQKAQEKELHIQKNELFEIEDLQKKLRLIEFTHKNELQELKKELGFQKALYDDQRNKTNDKSLIEIAKDLEEKLLYKEKEVLKLKESELDLKKQNYHLKKNKLSLDSFQKNQFNNSITQPHSLNKLSRLCSISINTPINLKIESKLEIINEKEFSHQKPIKSISHSATMNENDPFNVSSHIKKVQEGKKEFHPNILEEYITKLKEENKNLQEMLFSIKEAAVEAVMDKEKELGEANFQLQELGNAYTEQTEISNNTIQILEQKLSHYDSRLNEHSSLFMDKITQMEEEIEKNNQIYYDSQLNNEKIKENFIEQLEEMTSRLEQKKYEFEQELNNKENEMVMSLHQKISEFSESSKNSEIKLYEELQMVDDKLKIAEKSLKELQNESNIKEKKFQKEKKDLLKEIENLSRTIKELKPYKEKYNELENKFKTSVEDHHEEMKKKVEKMTTLELNKVSLNKRLMTIATEIRVVEYKYEHIHKDYEDLKVKFEAAQQNYEEHLKIMNMEFKTQKDNYEAIIDNIQMELETVKNELDLLKEPIEQNLANSATKKSIFYQKAEEKEKVRKNTEENQETVEESEPVRNFASFFSKKEVSDTQIMKMINQEAINNIETDIDSLKTIIARLEADCELYKKQLDDQSKENDILQQKINELKNFEEIHQDLEKLKDDYESQIELYKKEIELEKNHIHTLRAQLLQDKNYEAQINDLKEKVRVYQKEQEFMIKNTIYFKEEMARNYNFYNEELDKSKREFIQAKINYSQVLMDKEYLSLRCKQMENLIKQQNFK